MVVLGPAAMGLARAEEADAGTFSLVFENDVFSDADRHYTNGVRFSWISREGDVPEWVREGARRFPLFPEDGTVRSSFAVGQM